PQLEDHVEADLVALRVVARQAEASHGKLGSESRTRARGRVVEGVQALRAVRHRVPLEFLPDVAARREPEALHRGSRRGQSFGLRRAALLRDLPLLELPVFREILRERGVAEEAGIVSGRELGPRTIAGKGAS